MAEFILGNVNQGCDGNRGLWRPGDVFDGNETHTMFFTGRCNKDTFLYLPREAITDLATHGRYKVRVKRILGVVKKTQVAELDFPTFQDKRINTAIIMQVCGVDLEQHDLFPGMTMTIPEGSCLRAGMEFAVGYISVLEALGDGLYRLHHDYPTNGSSPRFEIFEK